MKLLSGNAAIAAGAIAAGVKVVTAYPGTPASDIYYGFNDAEIYREWSVNEKVALEVALGASIVGARSLCFMKNAGFNWLLDTLTAVTYTGVKAGLVIVVCDDPAAHFSVTEQDSRGIAKHLRLPCLEPSSPQECSDMVKAAFSLSERLRLPVVVRSVTRVAHTVCPVEVASQEKREQKISFERDFSGRKYCFNPYAPPRPVADHKLLMEKQPLLLQEAEKSPFLVEAVNGKRPGVITSGVAFAYVKEALGEKANILKLGFAFPVAEKAVREFSEKCGKLFVIEEGDSMVEGQVKAILGEKVGARKKKWGELSIEEVKNSVLL